MANSKNKTKKQQYKDKILELVEKRKRKPLSQDEEAKYAKELDSIWQKISKKNKEEIEKWFKTDLRNYIPNQKRGIKHLIDCHCTLPQYRNRKNRIFHKFVVFSVIDENDKVVPKFVQCNNCGIVHYVTELGKSEFLPKDEFPSILTIEDIKYSIPRDVREILDDHNSDLPTWEEVAFLYENKRWNSHVIISSDESEGLINNKILKIVDQNLVKVETISNQSEIIKNKDPFG